MRRYAPLLVVLIVVVFLGFFGWQFWEKNNKIDLLEDNNNNLNSEVYYLDQENHFLQTQRETIGDEVESLRDKILNFKSAQFETTNLYIQTLSHIARLEEANVKQSDEITSLKQENKILSERLEYLQPFKDRYEKQSKVMVGLVLKLRELENLKEEKTKLSGQLTVLEAVITELEKEILVLTKKSKDLGSISAKQESETLALTKRSEDLGSISAKQESEIQRLKKYLTATAFQTLPIKGEYRIVPIYFYPKDKKLDPLDLEKANQDIAIVQAWYREKLGGLTFQFAPVKALQGNHETVWYQSGSDAGKFDLKILRDDLIAILQLGTVPITDYYLVFIAGAETFLKENKTFGGYATSYSPRYIRKTRLAIIKTNPSLALLAHELGHAFDLPHPKNPQINNLMEPSVMISLWDGSFSEEEIEDLKLSPLIIK